MYTYTYIIIYPFILRQAQEPGITLRLSKELYDRPEAAITISISISSIINANIIVIIIQRTNLTDCYGSIIRNTDIIRTGTTPAPS